MHRKHMVAVGVGRRRLVEEGLERCRVVDSHPRRDRRQLRPDRQHPGRSPAQHPAGDRVQGAREYYIIPKNLYAGVKKAIPLIIFYFRENKIYGSYRKTISVRSWVKSKNG